MTTATLTLLERFGDAHLRYALRNGTIVDVIREGDARWYAYAMQDGARIGQEIQDAGSEAELLQLLERQFH
jgi:hypothetical protein